MYRFEVGFNGPYKVATMDRGHGVAGMVSGAISKEDVFNLQNINIVQMKVGCLHAINSVTVCS